jgi:hypothetical protein
MEIEIYAVEKYALWVQFRSHCYQFRNMYELMYIDIVANCNIFMEMTILWSGVIKWYMKT